VKRRQLEGDNSFPRRVYYPIKTRKKGKNPMRGRRRPSHITFRKKEKEKKGGGGGGGYLSGKKCENLGGGGRESPSFPEMGGEKRKGGRYILVNKGDYRSKSSNSKRKKPFLFYSTEERKEKGRRRPPCQYGGGGGPKKKQKGGKGNLSFTKSKRGDRIRGKKRKRPH